MSLVVFNFNDVFILLFPGGSHQIEALIMQHLWSVMTELTQGRQGLLYNVYFEYNWIIFYLSLFLIHIAAND